MNIKITKNINKANLVTHTGTFHPDDVFSTMFLSKIVDNPVLIRTNDPTNAQKESIIYDIGFGKFDHHGPNAEVREKERIKYSSFGLLWREFGRQYLEKINAEDIEKLWEAIDEKLVMQIDGIDNGVFPKIEAVYKLTDLDKIIDLFNKAWNEDVDNDDNFKIALMIADKIFERIVLKENAKIIASKKVELEINNVKDNILILNEYMPYQSAIFNSQNPLAKEIKVIVFPSNRGGYNVKPRTISEDSKELLVNFSKEFCGLHGEELANVSKIKTARFVHSSGFLGCTETLEDAILLAQNAINNTD